MLRCLVAMVTGAGEGVGRAYAEAMLCEGAKVMICDLPTSCGEKTSNELRQQFGCDNVGFLPLDVTCFQQIDDCLRDTLSKMGRLDILVNNVGIIDETDKGWEKMITTNLSGIVVGTKLGMKYMACGGGGTIINSSSVTSLKPYPTMPITGATKAAVSHFSRSMGDKLYFCKTKVKVMAINVGFTDTRTMKESGCKIAKELKGPHEEMMKSIRMQSVGNMGRGLIQVLQQGQTGQVWTVECDQPARMECFSS